MLMIIAQPHETLDIVNDVDGVEAKAHARLKFSTSCIIIRLDELRHKIQSWSSRWRLGLRALSRVIATEVACASYFWLCAISQSLQVKRHRAGIINRTPLGQDHFGEQNSRC